MDVMKIEELVAVWVEGRYSPEVPEEKTRGWITDLIKGFRSRGPTEREINSYHAARGTVRHVREQLVTRFIAQSKIDVLSPSALGWDPRYYTIEEWMIRARQLQQRIDKGLAVVPSLPHNAEIRFSMESNGRTLDSVCSGFTPESKTFVDQEANAHLRSMRRLHPHYSDAQVGRLAVDRTSSILNALIEQSTVFVDSPDRVNDLFSGYSTSDTMEAMRTAMREARNAYNRGLGISNAAHPIQRSTPTPKPKAKPKYEPLDDGSDRALELD